MPSALMSATELEKYIGELEEENKKLDEAYQIARDRVIELLGDIEQYLEHIKELEEELGKDDREVQVNVDKELLKANDYLIKENEKLKEENEKLKDKFMLRLAEAFLLPPTSYQIAEYRKWNYSRWYDEVKNQMRKEIKEED